MSQASAYAAANRVERPWFDGAGVKMYVGTDGGLEWWCKVGVCSVQAMKPDDIPALIAWLTATFMDREAA